MAFHDGLKKCERWAVSNLPKFGLGDVTDDKKIIKLKPLSELLLTIHVAQNSISKETVDLILNWAWQECEEGDLLFRVLVAKPDIYRLSSTIYLFKSFGFENARVIELLRHITEMKIYGAVEADKWIDIASDFAVSRIFGLPENNLLYRDSYLFKMPEPWILSEQSIYAITHEVFYATSFGSRASIISSDVLRYLSDWVPVWALVYEEQGNLDIVGELCIAMACLGDTSSTERNARNVLLNQHFDGSLDGPKDAGQQFMLITGAEMDDASFYRNYHTTLVAMCMFSMYLT